MTITRRAWDDIQAHGERGYPFEICGLLIGRLVDDERRIEQAWPVPNAWESDPEAKEGMLAGLAASAAGKPAGEWEAHGKERRFLVSPQETLACMKRARELKLDLLGVYHTHPNHPAVPSGFDKDAAVPGWSYIILSVRDGRAAECRSWELPWTEDEFEEESMRVID